MLKALPTLARSARGQPVTQSCPFMMTVANSRGEWNASVGRRPSLDVQRCRSKWEIEDRQIAAKLSIDTGVLAGRR